MSEQKMTAKASPKLSFILGLITGVAVLSLIGFFVLLTVVMPKKEENKNPETNTAETNKEAAQPKLSFANMADDLKLDIKKFNTCLENSQTAEKIEKDYQTGISLGIEGTPASYINGVLIAGAYPYEEVKKTIDGLLAGSIKPIENENLKVLPDDYILGSKDKEAKITIFEFSDFQCPFCQKFQLNINQALAEYKDKIRIIFKHFPLRSIHPNAQKAAEAAECAGLQGKFWEYADELFAKQGSW